MCSIRISSAMLVRDRPVEDGGENGSALCGRAVDAESADMLTIVNPILAARCIGTIPLMAPCVVGCSAAISVPFKGRADVPSGCFKLRA